MQNLPQLISDLSLILVCAALMSIIFKKLKQPVVLGYLMAGFLAGPYMPYTSTIIDMASIKTWADIGVIFLMFGLGLEFSFKKLLKIGTAPVVAVITMLLCMIGLGLMVAHGFGWSKINGLYLGGMMAIASTSIIVKSFEELGVKQEKFTTTVFGILILEDIIAIILMLLFGTLGKGGGSVDGEVLIMSLVSMAFYLVLWFVLGIYLIPLLLKKCKKFLNNETLLILSLALCFLMVVAASAAGFSAAFGAFVMGSILAETTEGEHIEHITNPIKNLFGAIFFVSVGMMIDPSVLVEYWSSILVITAVVLILGSMVDTCACLLGGIHFKEAIRCGFSLAQVGEFAFIIASLGVSLGAIEDCLYPIIVSVSVITTFTSPYMIKASGPIAEKLEPLLPEKLRRENHRNANASDTHIISRPWKSILRQSAIIILIYTVLCITVITICKKLVYPYLLDIFDGWWTDSDYFGTPDDIAKLITAAITMFGLLVFIRPLITKGLFDDKFWALWHNKQFNRAPLIFIIGLRGLVAVIMVTAAIDVLYHSISAAIIGLVLFAILYWVLLRQIKKGQSHMESVFKENYNSKEMAAKADRPTYEGDLLSKDVHLSEIKIPINSVWCGKTIKEADWGRKYEVNIASILRNSGRINIPSPDTVIFPNDRIQFLGSDEKLKQFAASLGSESQLLKIEGKTPDNEMQLLRIAVPENSVLVGVRIFDSGIREKFHCMIAGIDRGGDKLIKPAPDVVFCGGDIVWIVGESKNIRTLQKYANESDKPKTESK